MQMHTVNLQLKLAAVGAFEGCGFGTSKFAAVVAADVANFRVALESCACARLDRCLYMGSYSSRVLIEHIAPV
jgi:hypothetical protein